MHIHTSFQVVEAQNWRRRGQDKKQFLSSDISIFQPLGCPVIFLGGRGGGEKGEIVIGLSPFQFGRHFFFLFFTKLNLYIRLILSHMKV